MNWSEWSRGQPGNPVQIPIACAPVLSLSLSVSTVLPTSVQLRFLFSCVPGTLEYTQLLSCVQLFETPWTAACQVSLSRTISQSLLKVMSIVLVMPSSHLILWCPPLFLPSIFPSIREFSNESAVCIRWPKYWTFSFSISPSNKYLGLISLKIDWFDLFTVHSHQFFGSLPSLTSSSHNHTWPLGRQPWLYRPLSAE